MLLLAFAIVVFLSLLLTGRKLWTLQVALLMTIATTLYSKHIEQQCTEQLHCDIYRVGNRTAMEFFVGHDSYLLCDSNVAANPESIDFQTSGNLLWRKATRKAILRLDTIYENPWLLIDNGFVAFNGKTMRIIDRSNYRQQSNSHPRLDYLLLRESPYITVEQLRKQYSFDTLIIASQNSQRRRKAWQKECDSLSIPCRE